MQENPFFSIVMPVYNAELYLKDSVSSILAQTFTDWELILVDDCSNDASGRMCDELSENDKRIKVIHLEKNGGAGNARNKGIGIANGIYLTFMDADDYIENDLYQLVVDSTMSKSMDVIVWGLTEDYYNEQNKLVSQNRIALGNKICNSRERVKKEIIYLEEKTLFGYQWNHAYKLSLINEHGIYFNDMVFYEDYFFNVSTLPYLNTMAIIDTCAYHYKKRMNDSVTTRFVKEYFLLSTKRVQSMYECYTRWDMYTPDVRDILGNIYLRYILSGLMRNSNPKSQYTMHKKKHWVQKVRQSELFQETAGKCIVKKRTLKFLQKALNNKNDLVCIVMGKLVYIVKEKMPIFFQKRRQVK